MIGRSKLVAALPALIALFGAQAPAGAITAELAKKCRTMAVKEHPTPRIGTKTGEHKAQTVYFRDCVAKNGNMDEQKKPDEQKK